MRNLEFIQGENRNQINLLPSSIDEYIDEDNPTRVIDVYVESLDLQALGFEKGNRSTTTPSPKTQALGKTLRACLSMILILLLMMPVWFVT